MLTILTLLAIALAPPAPAVTPTSTPDFVTVLQRNFAAWDKDRNNMLTPAEIDAALSDPKLAGDDAAAAATVKCVARDNLFRVRRIDVATINDDLRLGRPENRSPVFNDEWFAPKWQAAFEIVRKRSPAVSPPGALASPNVETLKLDSCGSATFVAVLGGLARQRPDAAQAMIVPGRGDSFQVVTPLWSQAIASVTEGQAAACSTTGNEWARAIECGVDALTRERFPQATYNGKIMDFNGRFACAQQYILYLCGKQSTITPFRRPNGTRTKDGEQLGLLGNPEGLASTALQILSQAMTKKKVAVATTEWFSILGADATGPNRREALPPNINAFGCCAIVGLDSRAKTITLWDPSGGAFAPSGPASIANGYPMSDGIWTMPLKDFAQVFNGFVVEGDNRGTIPGQSRGKR
ncbi:MAG: hypothetical protein KF805_11265 [Phycisphaeraceae bacterium]|nr:hypothetical protein [Phycisphaeraceae bacterium]